MRGVKKDPYRAPIRLEGLQRSWSDYRARFTVPALVMLSALLLSIIWGLITALGEAQHQRDLLRSDVDMMCRVSCGMQSGAKIITSADGTRTITCP